MGFHNFFAKEWRNYRLDLYNDLGYSVAVSMEEGLRSLLSVIPACT